MQRIAIVCCYFGSLPNYFSLWLKSCAANPTIDWLFFTDQTVENLPENVHLHHTTLDAVADLARARTGFSTLVLPTPYKLCDYKVMYGEIFQDYLKDYDFWGYCDFDMLFGDLRKFLPPERLDHFDKIFAMGHLSLYRNTPESNARYRLPGGKFSCREVMENPVNYAFDEWRGIYRIYKENHLPMFDEALFADLTCNRKRFSLQKRTSDRYPAPAPDYPHQLFYWENGHVLRAFLTPEKKILTDEFAYIHFFKRRFPTPDRATEQAEAIFCTPKGFLPKEPGILPTEKEIRQLNPYPGALYEKIEFKIRRKILKYRNHRIFAGREAQSPKRQTGKI